MGEWLIKNKFALAGYLIFLLPALLIPAMVHKQDEMKRWVYFAEIFCTPLATVVGNLGKKRTAVYCLGLTSFLLPIEVMWTLGYTSSYHPPTKDQIAAFYLPMFFFLLIACMIIGFWLTYVGTRKPPTLQR